MFIGETSCRHHFVQWCARASRRRRAHKYSFGIFRRQIVKVCLLRWFACCVYLRIYMRRSSYKEYARKFYSALPISLVFINISKCNFMYSKYFKLCEYFMIRAINQVLLFDLLLYALVLSRTAQLQHTQSMKFTAHSCIGNRTEAPRTNIK